MFGRPGTGKNVFANVFLTQHLLDNPTQPFAWIGFGFNASLMLATQEMGLSVLSLKAHDIKKSQSSFNCFAFPVEKMTASLKLKHFQLLTDFFLNAWHLDNQNQKNVSLLSLLFHHFYQTYTQPDWIDWIEFLKETQSLPDSIRLKALSHAQQWIVDFGISHQTQKSSSPLSKPFSGIILDLNLDLDSSFQQLKTYQWATLFVQWMLMGQYSQANPLLFIWDEAQRLEKKAEQSVWIQNLEHSLFFQESYHFILCQTIEEMIEQIKPTFLKTLISIDPFYPSMNHVLSEYLPFLKTNIVSFNHYATALKNISPEGHFGTLGIFEQNHQKWTFQMGRMMIQPEQLWMFQEKLEEKVYLQKMIQQYGFKQAILKTTADFPKGFIP